MISTSTTKNWEGIQAFLGQVDWENLLQDKTADEILEIIYEKTLEAAKENVPARNSETKQIPKHKRVRMNLTRKRRRINKQYQKATAPTRKKCTVKPDMTENDMVDNSIANFFFFLFIISVIFSFLEYVYVGIYVFT